TLDRSREWCLLKYEKPQFDAVTGIGPGGWKAALSKCNLPFNPQQIPVFKAIHAWRDRTAREEDESLQYVLPINMLCQLAQKMPQEASEVIACCNPPPKLVRINAMNISLLIQ